jgi:VWFA-related protein
MRVLASGLATAFCVSSAIFQTPQPVIRSGSQVVRVTVVARDRGGKPASGLTADDFVVTEDRKSVAISFFQEVKGPAPANTSSATASAGTFSNVSATAAPPNVTVILLDRLNTKWDDQARARDALRVILAQARPDDRLAVYALDGSALRVLHDFTRDARSLLDAVNGSARPTSAETDVRSDPDAPPMVAQFMATRASTTTMVALQTIGAHLSAVPGRKNLVWVSAGFNINDLDHGPDVSAATAIQRATRELNAAGISVYPIDPSGLAGPFSQVTATTTTFGSFSGQMDSHAILQTLAEATGGRVFVNNNDVAGSIRTAIDDAEQHYEIDYYSPSPAADGRYREIKVTTRKPVELRYRQGYYATPASAPGGDRKTALERAIGDPLDASAIPVTLTPSAAAGGVQLAISIDGHRLSLAHQGDAWIGTLDLAIAQVKADGATAVDVDTTVRLHVTDQQHDALLQKGLTVTKTVALGPQAARLVVVIRDTSTGELGSVVVPAARLRGPQ